MDFALSAPSVTIIRRAMSPESLGRRRSGRFSTSASRSDTLCALAMRRAAGPATCTSTEISGSPSVVETLVRGAVVDGQFEAISTGRCTFLSGDSSCSPFRARVGFRHEEVHGCALWFHGRRTHRVSFGVRLHARKLEDFQAEPALRQGSFERYWNLESWPQPLRVAEAQLGHAQQPETTPPQGKCLTRSRGSP